jgi:hypothetical protein
MKELLCSSPLSLILLPKLLFDEEGNIKEFSLIGLSLEPCVKTKICISENFKINYDENNVILNILNDLKNYYNLNFIEINFINYCKIFSLNYLNSLVLSCCIPYLWINNYKNLYENLNLIDNLLIKNKVGLETSFLLHFGGLCFISKSYLGNFIYKIPINLKDKNVIILERGSYNFFDIIKDIHYRNVLSHHTLESYEVLKNNLNMEIIYEENLRVAYNAGLIDDDLFDIIKMLRKEGFYAGYNFFAKGIHVIAEKEKTEKVIRILEGIAGDKNISIYNVNYTGLIFE